MPETALGVLRGGLSAGEGPAGGRSGPGRSGAADAMRCSSGAWYCADTGHRSACRRRWCRRRATATAPSWAAAVIRVTTLGLLVAAIAGNCLHYAPAVLL